MSIPIYKVECRECGRIWMQCYDPRPDCVNCTLYSSGRIITGKLVFQITELKQKIPNSWELKPRHIPLES